MNLKMRYAEINAPPQSGGRFFIDMDQKELHFSSTVPACNGRRKMKIGIYAGKGASHSWLWFVDMFENMGFINLEFLDDQSIRHNLVSNLDVLIISGGDTFAVAEALGKKGAECIIGFVENGGTYVGSCAGAYLPMHSTKKPLDLFNFVNVKITNLAKSLPESMLKNYRLRTSYGCDFIFHPVREAVRLKQPHGQVKGGMEFNAPLYGGPGMIHDNPDNILAYYSGFTEKTAFYVDPKTAENSLIGKAAVVRIPVKKGCFYLFGPHLEHPHYPDANHFVANILIRENTRVSNREDPETDLKTANSLMPEIISGQAAKNIIRDLKRELSNSRIAASGLEFMDIQWMIGKKIYDPPKIRVFLEAMWKRIGMLEKKKKLAAYSDDVPRIIDMARHTTTQIRWIKNAADQNIDTLDQATCLFETLQELSVRFFDIYFLSIMNFAL